jgi:hypothetical protein
MINNAVNSLRALKGLYDFVSSDKKFYVDSRAELKNGVGYSIQQFREGLTNPRPASEKPALIRIPFKIALAILVAVIMLSMIASSITDY